MTCFPVILSRWRIFSIIKVKMFLKKGFINNDNSTILGIVISYFILKFIIVQKVNSGKENSVFIIKLKTKLLQSL